MSLARREHRARIMIVLDERALAEIDAALGGRDRSLYMAEAALARARGEIPPGVLAAHVRVLRLHGLRLTAEVEPLSDEEVERWWRTRRALLAARRRRVKDA